MRVRQNKKHITIQFQSPSETSKDENQNDQQTQAQVITNFIYPIQGFPLFQSINSDLQKIKKKLIAFTNQYGSKNQKTTSIFLNYLQNTRQVGLSYLKNKDLIKASSYFSDCLSFIDPEYDQVFLQKFINIKIDIINKLMYCILEIESWERNQFNYNPKRIDYSINLMDGFLVKIKQYSFYTNLIKSQNCLLEVTFFYFGRLYKKKKRFKKAEEEFKTSLHIIHEKLENKVYAKNEELQYFLKNLSAKIYYKLSKCFRQDKNQKAQQKLLEYEKQSLKIAKSINNVPLFVYLNRKIRFYRKKKAFQGKLLKIDGKKRIEQQILKIIEQTKQTQIQSLYDVYLDQMDQDII